MNEITWHENEEGGGKEVHQHSPTFVQACYVSIEGLR
jgi:hypothetical protein